MYLTKCDQILTFSTKLNQIPRTFWLFSQTISLAYSHLNSVRFSCSSEVTLSQTKIESKSQFFPKVNESASFISICPCLLFRSTYPPFFCQSKLLQTVYVHSRTVRPQLSYSLVLVHSIPSLLVWPNLENGPVKTSLNQLSKAKNRR